jgi:4-hydroxybenzoate polyprenyltransferase
VVSVDLPQSVRDCVGRLGKPTTHIEGAGPTLKTWIKALRVPQYAENLLVFVPLVTSHAFTPSNILHAILAFVAFSLCASSVYLLNDLVDLDSDRRHPHKRHRPFASGAIPLAYGPPAIILLLGAAAVVAWSISGFFLAALACYWVMTLSYSLWLKRKLIVDVVVLAGLYTIRVIAGAIALPVVLSEWLLAFSMFIFVALALVKRYVELSLRIEHDLPDATNRNYRLRDLPIVGALAAASAFNSISVFALYVSADQTRELYARPELLWLICPLLLYWLGRVLVLAHRRIIEDDPVVFALRDRVSAVTGALTFAIMIAAS